MTKYDPSAYREFFEHEFSYLGGFWRNTHRYANRIALIDPVEGSAWSYMDLGNKVAELAAGLRELGVAEGDVVTYQLFNGMEFAQLYLGCQAAGAIGSPINYRLAPGEVAFIIDDSLPKVFVYDTSLAKMVDAALGMAKHHPNVLVGVGTDGDLASKPGSKSLRFDELYVAGGGASKPSRTIYDETTRLYTSGTTGMPKGVPLNSAVEIFSAHDVIMHFPLIPEDRTLNMTPWFHRGGLYSGGPNPVFYVGAAAVPMRSFDPGLCLDYVERLSLTFLIGAPTNLAMLAAAQSELPRDLSSLRGIVTMGAPLDRAAALRYQNLLTPRIFNGYGTTEAFWNTFLRPSDLPEHAGSAGRACTDDDVAVVKLFEDRLAFPNETVAKDGSEIGEVIVRSPKSGFAYSGAGNKDMARFHNGWLHIGDLATWDEEEFVTIVGRKDDMLISGGENVHPVQVEEVLNEHPGIADSLVVGVPDAQWGSRVVAYVVRSDPTLTATQCDEFCREHEMLSGYKRPRAYRFVDSLPLTATGKKLHYRAAITAAEEYGNNLFEIP
ncbi:MAG: long-chain fatty acid--CoA ligase [Actinomycetota bacterium]|nr:MAG: long-chain fatty acid--CoA ligase [Actinomycetota bacterium]